MSNAGSFTNYTKQSKAFSNVKTWSLYCTREGPHFSLFLNARPVAVYHQMFKNQDLVFKGCQQEIQDLVVLQRLSTLPDQPLPLLGVHPTPCLASKPCKSLRGITINKRTTTTTKTHTKTINNNDNNNNNQPADHPVLFLLAGCWALNTVARFRPIFHESVKCCQSSIANISPKYP